MSDAERTGRDAADYSDEELSAMVKAANGANPTDAPANGSPAQRGQLVQRGQLQQGFVSAADLDNMEIEDRPAIVAGLLTEGLNILAGRPKIGKSWLGLDIGIHVANGEPLFDQFETIAGRVVYFALEDSWRRLQGRMRKLLAGLPHPDQLDFNLALARLDEGGLDVLRTYLGEHPDTKLLIIDTLAKVKPKGKRGGDAYQEDYAAGHDLQKIAFEFNVAILLLHHTRKVMAEYVLDEVSGTTGLTGSADTILVLKQNPDTTHTLHVTGRDIESGETPLRWNSETVSFTTTDVGEQAVPTGAVDRAATWLATYLAPGPRWVGNIEHDGAEAGHKWRTIRRAYKALAVQNSRVEGRSFWHLPIEAGQVGHVGQVNMLPEGH